MKKFLAPFSFRSLLFISFAILAFLMVVTIGLYVLNRDQARFELESAQIRRDYFHNQRMLIKSEVERVIDFIQYQWAKSEDRLKESVKTRTLEACAMAEHLAKECSGLMSAEQTKAVIRDALRSLRFNSGRGYCFIVTLEGLCLLNPERPELEGTIVLDVRDENGSYVIRDMLSIVRTAGEGFCRYSWPNPNVPGQSSPKIAYVMYSDTLGGFIGSSEYLDEVEKEIQAEVLERIGQIRFGEGNYIFVVSYDGITLMNGFQPELIGRNMWDMTDPYGVKVIQEERLAAERPEGGFIRYHWEKPSSGQLSLKTSYIRGFPQWRWMVGTGVYLDEVESVIAAREDAARQVYRRDSMALLLLLVGTLGVIILLSFGFSRLISKEFNVFLGFFRHIEKGGGAPIDPECLRLREFQSLGNSANNMLAMRNRTEAELRESRERLNSLFENMAEGVALHEVILDETNKPVDYRVVDCNRKYEVILGLRRETVTGKLATEIYGGDEPPYMDRYARVALTGTPDHFQTHFVPMDRHFEISVAPWGRQGFATIFVDITERRRIEEHQKQLEAQLNQALKMESVGRLAGGVAHDFNNMLTPIMGYAEILTLDMESQDPRRGDLEQIILAARRARDLTRQLLAFARKQTLEMKPIDLNEVIVGLEKMLRRTLRENVVIEAHLVQHACSMVGDQNQVEQIILNLAVNAQDAMQEGGRLVIETSEVLLDAEYASNRPEVTPGPHVMMAISDTGSGMDRETMARIFDPFFTTKELGRGTGLGLSAVYGIVKQHHGHIWVYSEPGRGTTFRIYFPQSIAAESTDPDSSVKMEVVFLQGDETILVVEDEEQVRTMTSKMLGRYGYTVIEAPDGATALEQAAAHGGPVHLLLTDVVMPDMNGKQLHDRLATTRPHMKVLYMSGYTENAIAHHGVLNAGVNYIQKPFAVEALLRRVRSILDQR